MRFCNKCRVEIENESDTCPLCKQPIVKQEGILEKDFPTIINKKAKNLNIATRLLIFLLILLFGINVVINILFGYKLFWSLYSIAPLFYAYMLIDMAMRSHKNIGKIVLNNLFMLSIISIILDNMLGFDRWSFNYAIPLLILTGILALLIFIFIKPTLYINYFVYIILIASFALILLLLLLLGFITIKLPSVIAIFVSIMAVIALVLFGDRRIKNELIKRFHF
jgi:RNA polymerase subunit RPABC4/transcription elongation factor Spt4